MKPPMLMLALPENDILWENTHMDGSKVIQKSQALIGDIFGISSSIYLVYVFFMHARERYGRKLCLIKYKRTLRK